MASIVLGWTECKSYLETIGPGLGHPERPRSCPYCEGEGVWYDGWRTVFCVVVADGVSHRFDDGLALQRIVCSECCRSWTLRPSFLYPHRSFEPDVAEAAALAYLGEPSATYEGVGAAFGCSARSVWRWVGWPVGLLVAGEFVAQAARFSGSGNCAALIPRVVPQDHEKAYSPERSAVLLRAFQGLSAVAIWARAQLVPPQDPSPLRFWLTLRFLAVREVHYLVRAIQSPPLPVDETGPPRIDRRA